MLSAVVFGRDARFARVSADAGPVAPAAIPADRPQRIAPPVCARNLRRSGDCMGLLPDTPLRLWDDPNQKTIRPHPGLPPPHPPVKPPSMNASDRPVGRYITGSRSSDRSSSRAPRAAATRCPHLRVKGADVETRAEPGLRATAQFENLEFPHLVGERLPRPRDVALHLGLDVGVAERGVGAEVVDRLLARPALRVHACIHDEPHGAPHFRGKRAELGVRIGVQAEVTAERLRIQCPSLAIRGVVREATGSAACRSLPADRALVVVTGIASCR